MECFFRIEGPFPFTGNESHSRGRLPPDNLLSEPDVRELLDYMERDAMMRHEIFLCFYRYKEKKDQQDKKLGFEETVTVPGESG